MITKFQQGGQIEQQLVQLVQAAMSGDQQATQQIDKIMQAAQQGNQKAIQIANYIQKIAKQLQGSRKARLGAKLNYYKYLKQSGPLKYQKGGWINKSKGIWNWDSLDRMNRVKNYYLGKSDLSDDDWMYITDNPELESFLHNVYKNSKIQGVNTTVTEGPQSKTNNFPKGADPNAKISFVPDSANNYKGYIGVGKFKMLPTKQVNTSTSKPRSTKQSNRTTVSVGRPRMNQLAAQQQITNRAQTNGYMYGAGNQFENMVAREHTGLDSNWRNDIKTYVDPKTGKSYKYITVDGINYLDNGRYWNPQTKRGGNYTWKPGWRIFGGGFHLM